MHKEDIAGYGWNMWKKNNMNQRIEYGTPEYWEKERKSKFIRNARQKEKAIRNNPIKWIESMKIVVPIYEILAVTDPK